MTTINPKKAILLETNDIFSLMYFNVYPQTNRIIVDHNMPTGRIENAANWRT